MNPHLVPTLHRALQLIRDLATDGSSLSDQEAIIRDLTGSIAENLFDTILLCEHGRSDSALRLMRTPYEKFLYANHLAMKDDKVERFLRFEKNKTSSHRRKLDKVSDVLVVNDSEEGSPSTDEFPRCGGCGRRESWTKTLPEQMALVANVPLSYHYIAYDLSTLLIHPSKLGIAAQENRSVRIGAVIQCAHLVAWKTLLLQQFFLSRQDISIETVENMIAALLHCVGVADLQLSVEVGLPN